MDASIGFVMRTIDLSATAPRLLHLLRGWHMRGWRLSSGEDLVWTECRKQDMWTDGDTLNKRLELRAWGDNECRLVEVIAAGTGFNASLPVCLCPNLSVLPDTARRRHYLMCT